MDFYYAKGTIAFASLIALEEIGVKFALHKLDFQAQEQRGTDYLQKNPKGRVPLLVSDEGAISETPAILTYLAMRYPEKALIPGDAYHFARVQEALSYFASTFHVAHSMRLRGARWSDDPAVQENLRLKVRENMSACAQYVETHLFEGPYLFQKYSIADMHLYAISNWFEVDDVDIRAFPKLASWRAEMDERKAVKRAWELMDS